MSSEEGTGATGMTGGMQDATIFALQPELCLAVFNHIEAQDLNRMLMTCKQFKSMLDNDINVWKASLQRNIVGPCPPVTLPLTFRELALTVDAAVRGKPKKVTHRVVGASSMDREDEDPSHVLTWSKCMPDIYGLGGASQRHFPHNLVQNCMCWRWPCYWSSQPSQDRSSSEWLLIKLLSSVCLITEVSLYPYKAFWQPVTPAGAVPVYAPKQCEFQFGTWIPPLARPEEKDEYNLGLVVKVSDEPLAISATLGPYSVPHSEDGIRVKLPEPVLAIGGMVRLMLIGRAQALPFEPRSDYYTCIQYVGVEGFALNLSTTLNEASEVSVTRYGM